MLILRIANQVRREALKNQLEKTALLLAERITERSYTFALDSISYLISLVSLSKALYEIGPSFAERANSQLLSLKSDLEEMTSLTFNLERQAEAENSEVLKSRSADTRISQGISQMIGGQPSESVVETIGNGNGNGANSIIRQSAICNVIRQLGKASMKDIIAEFPEVSERTIRYDLQKLCNQGSLSRIGNGGPSTYYTFSTADNPAV